VAGDGAVGGGGGTGGDTGGGGSGACANGAAVCNPSCATMTGNECIGGDCCASILVPGGRFSPGLTTDRKLTVSSFRLDKYEVTVGRYRQFVAASADWRRAGNPVADAGGHPNIPGSGWHTDWMWPVTTVCDLHTEYSLWGDATHDAYPMNCVSWTTAAAFCIWDGGRLPTEMEWEFAASGGEADTRYPWGDTPVLTGKADDSAAYAVYASLGDGNGDLMSYGDMLPVGSRPAGASPFGQMDLIGSLWEMVLDSDNRTALPNEATDYANIDRQSFNRVAKGGSWEIAPITAASRAVVTAIGVDYAIGWRCARDH